MSDGTPIPDDQATLSYTECLAEIESFMADSGIRQFCSEVCHGQCCVGCWDRNPNACHRNEGRRITCSAFICGELLTYLELPPCPEFKSVILDVVCSAMTQASGSQFSSNPYYSIHTPAIQAQCEFPCAVLTQLPDEDQRADIRRRIDFLRQQPECSQFVWRFGLTSTLQKRYREHRVSVPTPESTPVMEEHHV